MSKGDETARGLAGTMTRDGKMVVRLRRTTKSEDQVNIGEYERRYKGKGTSPEDQEVESEVFKVSPTGFIYTSTRTPGTVFVILIQL